MKYDRRYILLKNGQSPQNLTREQLLANQKAIELTTEEEELAIKFRRILFGAYTLFLAPLLSNDLRKKHKIRRSNRKLDTCFCLNVMIEEFNKDPNLFPIYMANTQEIIESALLGRNAIIHCFLSLILQQ